MRQCHILRNQCILIFQSTHPSWGATLAYLQAIGRKRDFNPRTHRGVRPARPEEMRRDSDFNPRTHRGVRHLFQWLSMTNVLFQSTHPSWGATRANAHIKEHVGISIHAPIVGCDIFSLF